jgi:hypothetical protein
MAQFQYTAVNQAGKKLSGVIGAQSEDDARHQLNAFGISLLGIEKISESPSQSVSQEPATSSELQKFEFEAYDKNGQKIVGTVPASSRFKAHQRLKEEYQFDVAYLVNLGATEEEKEKARKEDLSLLDPNRQSPANSPIQDLTQQKFDEKRQSLLKQVDFILDKIKNLLSLYSEKMNPSSQKNVQTYVDKLMRIRSSTNLDYIEHTTEELLKKVQDEELFLHKEIMSEEQKKVHMETAQLMVQLQSNHEPQALLTDDLEKIEQVWSHSESRFVKAMAQFLAKFLPSPEEKVIKKQIAGLNTQIWATRKLWINSKQENRATAKQALEAVKEQKKQLVRTLQEIKKTRNLKAPESIQVKKNLDENQAPEPYFTEEITQFLGWILGLYLSVYFLSYYAFAKKLPFEIPNAIDLLQIPVLRKLLICLFAWYIVLALRIQYLRYQKWANLMAIPLGVIISAGLVFNL